MLGLKLNHVSKRGHRTSNSCTAKHKYISVTVSDVYIPTIWFWSLWYSLHNFEHFYLCHSLTLLSMATVHTVSVNSLEIWYVPRIKAEKYISNTRTVSSATYVKWYNMKGQHNRISIGLSNTKAMVWLVGIFVIWRKCSKAMKTFPRSPSCRMFNSAIEWHFLFVTSWSLD